MGWCLGLVAGALALLVGFSEPTVDPFPTIGFVLGALLGAVPAAARLWDVVATRRS